MKERLIVALRVFGSVQNQGPIDQADVDLLRGWVGASDYGDPEELACVVIGDALRRYKQARTEIN